MRCLMGEAHRQCILAACQDGARILEWGMGGTTAWLARRLPGTAHLTSIEHDPRWFAEVQAQVGSNARCDLRLRPSSAPPARNATIDEESDAGLTDYITAGGEKLYDVIVVDGVARNACLEQAARLLAPGGRVYLHDAQRPWYDRGKRHFRELEVVGTCPDYPSPWLWVGTTGPQAPPHAGAPPVIVSFYTPDTGYEMLADRLRLDCGKLLLESVIEALPTAGSWARNTNLKADFCRRQWRRLGRPILWVDIDARVRERPCLGSLRAADVGVHKWGGWQIATGTMFLNQTALAGEFLDAWCAWCERLPEHPDQIAADLAWECVSSRYPLRTAWLPQRYCHIFDSPPPAGGGIVIEHFQASRQLKAEVSGGHASPYPDASAHLRACRAASRPRRWTMSHGDSAALLEELSDEVADELPPQQQGDDWESAWLCAAHDSLRRGIDAAVTARLEAAARTLAQSHEPYVVYGCGHIGRQLAASGRQHGLAPAAFVESQVPGPDSCDGLPVWTPERARAEGIRLYLLGSLASRDAMRARLQWTFRDCAERYRTEPAEDAMHLLGTGMPGGLGDAPLREALTSVALGRTLGEHAWLFAHRERVVDATLSLTPMAQRLAHVDRYRFAAALAAGGTVLDLTGGVGDGSRWLASHGHVRRVIALVEGDSALSYAGRHHAHPAVEYIAAGPAAIEGLSPGSVQLALHLAPSPVGARGLLRSLVRVLADEAGLVIAMPATTTQDALPNSASLDDLLREHFSAVDYFGQWPATPAGPGTIASTATARDGKPCGLLAVGRRPRRSLAGSGAVP